MVLIPEKGIGNPVNRKKVFLNDKGLLFLKKSIIN